MRAAVIENRALTVVERADPMPGTGELLVTNADAEHDARIAAQARATVAEQRSTELEAENRRLRDELAQQPRDSSN